MTPLQQLEIRASEIRQRLSAIADVHDMTDELRSELESLRSEYQDNERKQTARRIAGDEPETPVETRTNAEGVEFRGILGRASVGEIFDSAINHRSLDGATREIQSHYGLDANQVPLALLVRNWPSDSELETRAVTAAPSDVGQNQASIVPWVFPDSAATYSWAWICPQLGQVRQVYPRPDQATGCYGLRLRTRTQTKLPEPLARTY